MPVAAIPVLPANPAMLARYFLISDALPFGRLWYAISNAVDYAKFRSRSNDAVIRVYDEAGNLIETHEQAANAAYRWLRTAGHGSSDLINTITMEPGEALGLAAQIAVALAGVCRSRGCFPPGFAP